ncbi:MAG: protein kinase [Planctomycetes bacterium]|nr:protein kinase [Planctomycetota bacterium]
MTRSEDFLKRKVLEKAGPANARSAEVLGRDRPGEQVAVRAVCEKLADEADLAAWLDAYAAAEAAAGRRAAAESVRFGRAVAAEGKASAVQVWAAIRTQEEARAKGQERSLDHFLAEMGVLDAASASEILAKKGREVLVCRDCGRREIVTGEDKTGSFTCPECDGVLLPASQVKSATLDRAQADPLAGQVVGGCRLEKKLGAGGMGYVYKATHLALNKPVAVKFLSEQITNDLAKKRFLKEARAAARLDHPNIVAVHDTGFDAGKYYIVMQFVDGESVSGRLKREGRISVPEALRLGLEAARGIASAHALNMIHRDIKPDNLMTDRHGTVKVADFGLAKDLSDDSGLTLSQQAMGTPHYMSPEQANDARSADRRSDIYSFGATLYSMLAGAPPFTGSTPWAIIQAHQTKPIADLREANPDVPGRLWLAIRKMMEKKPEDRFQDMEAVIAELEEIRRDLAGSPPLPLSPAPARAAGAPPASAYAPTVTAPGPDARRGEKGGAGEAGSAAPPLLPEAHTPYTYIPQEQKKTGFLVKALTGIAVVAVGGLVVAVLALSGAFGNGKGGSPGSGTGGQNPAPPADPAVPAPGKTPGPSGGEIPEKKGLPGPEEPGEKTPETKPGEPGMKTPPVPPPDAPDPSAEAEAALAPLLARASELSGGGRFPEAVAKLDEFPARFAATPSWARKEREKSAVAASALAAARRDLAEAEALALPERAAEADGRLDRIEKAMAALSAAWAGAAAAEGWSETAAAVAARRKALRALAGELAWIAGATAGFAKAGDEDLAAARVRLEASASGSVPGAETAASAALEACRREQDRRSAARESDRFAAASSIAGTLAGEGKFAEALAALEAFREARDPALREAAARREAEIEGLKGAWERFAAEEAAALERLADRSWSGLARAAEALRPFDAETAPPVLRRKAAARLAEVEAAGLDRVRAFEAEGLAFFPGGTVKLGSEDPRDRSPGRETALKPFLLARREVTNAEYSKFVAETGRASPRHWKGGKPPQGLEDHPVVFVCEADAEAYCEWASRASGRVLRLPTADEWEAAASLGGGRGGERVIGGTRAALTASALRPRSPSDKPLRYPWGDVLAKVNANLEGGKTAPPGSFPGDSSPCGALDMAGNVSEWVRVPGPDGTASWAACGGCFEDGGAESAARCAARQPLPPGTRGRSLGFRVARELD